MNAKRWWRAVRDDPRRRATNLAAAATDALGLQASAGLSLGLIIMKTFLQESLPWLALRCATFSAATHAAALLATRRPVFYARHRELLNGLIMLHVLLTTLDGVLHGGTNILRHENVEGSPLLLLALLSICNTAVWLALFSLFVRLPVRFNCVTLPILALVPASASPSVCRRLLDTPGGEAPLAALYALLGLAHGAVASPELVPVVLHVAEPTQQCLVVCNWSLWLLGVLMPLCLMWELERCAEGVGRQEWLPQVVALLLKVYMLSSLLWYVLVFLMLRWPPAALLPEGD